jgi:hypothetical protein
MKQFFIFMAVFATQFAYCEPAVIESELNGQFQEAMDAPEAFIFVPPKDWLGADPKMLPPSVKAMVIGKSNKAYPPSINIGLEPYDGSLKSYLKNIKMINDAQNATWKDLGQIATESGQASLSSVDMTTEWGDVRLLHAILIRYGTAYIMTCASLKEEFSTNYKDFFQAMRSMKINKDVYEMVSHPELRTKLINTVQKLKKEWTGVWDPYQKNEAVDAFVITKSGCFQTEDFQKYWNAFNDDLEKNYLSMGPKWKDAMIAKAKKELGLMND